MPVAAAALEARAAGRVAAAAIALALQGAFYWLILQEVIRQPTAPLSSTPLEVTVLQKAKRLRPLSSPLNSRPEIPKRLAPPSEPPPPAGMTEPITLPRESKSAPPAAIDWRQALQSEARAEQAPSGPRKLRFGFPRAPRPDPAPPKFGWDYARTHRIVPLPHGGMIINFSERCSINVWYPIPLCRFGKLPVNGHLFDGLRSRRRDRADGLP
jgi:hypothetical protein